MTPNRFRTAVLAVALALALAAAAASAGCTDDGDDWEDDAVAAYVGDTAITEAELDAVADDLRAEIGAEIERELTDLAGELDEAELAERREQRYGELDQQIAVNRTRTLEMRILTEAADRYIAAEGLEPPEVPQTAVDQQADDLGLSPDSAYVQVVTRFFGTLGVLQATTEPVPPSVADQREVHEHLVADGLTTVPFEEAQPALNQELIGRPVAMRNLLAEVLERAEVRVSPAYELVYRVPVPVGSGQSWLALPLGGSG
jgi:hypothetical protein